VLPNLEQSSIENTARGAYVIREAEVPELVVLATGSDVSPCVDAPEAMEGRRVQVVPELVLLATGSEVGLCIDAAKAMVGRRVRVVSMPSWEVFAAQEEGYRAAVLPAGVPKLSVEAASTFGWSTWADSHIGIDDFGASAPGGTCFEKFGFSIANVVACAERCLRGEKGVLSDGSQARA
jgi:transketolase